MTRSLRDHQRLFLRPRQLTRREHAAKKSPAEAGLLSLLSIADFLEVHTAAHATHAATRTAMSVGFFLLRRFADHRFGRDHQASDRRSVLQRGARDLGRIENAEL